MTMELIFENFHLVAEITEAAMRGELNFKESFHARIALLKGMPETVLQVCVAVCCSVLQCVAVCCSVLQCGVLQCVAVWCVAVCRVVLQCVVLQCVVVCCGVLQCVAVVSRSYRAA